MYSRIKLITGSLILCTVMLGGSVGAETVYLRSGRKITGTIVGQGRTWVAVRSNGRRQVIRKSRIRRISYRRSAPTPITGAGKKAAEERRKKIAEERRKRRIARERRLERERLQRAAAARKKAEAERKRRAAVAAALAKKKAEEEKKRKAAAAALAKKKAEEDKKRKAVAAAALAKKKAEEEKKRKAIAAAALAKKKAEEDKKRKAIAAAALAKKKAEEEKKRTATTAIAARKKAEEEKKRKAAALAKKKAEIAALKRKQEEDRKRAIALRKKAEEDKQRKAAAKARSAAIPGWQAALYSAALPGLGQWLQGRRGEAVTYGSLFGIGLVAAYEANRRVLNATRDYNETSNPFSTTTLLQQQAGINVIPSSADLADPAVATLYSSNFELQRQAIDEHFRTYQQYTLFAGLIYAWNIADAFLADADPNYGYAADVTPLKAAMWSAIIPGWGQWKTNRRNTGIFYAGVVAAGLVGMYEKNRNVRNASRDYDELNNPYTTSNLLSVAVGASTGQTATDAVGASIVNNQFAGQRDALNRHYREFQQLGYLTLAVYAWSVADAYFFTRTSPGRLASSDEPSPAGLTSRGMAIAPVLIPGADNQAPRAGMRFAWNFSF